MPQEKPVYTLRSATNSDYEWLRQLHHAVMRESLERVRSWDEAQQDEYFRSSFVPDQLQIVQMEGEDVGVLRVERGVDALFLRDIQIAVSHQGMGLGTALIRDIQIEARERGLPVTLRVLRGSRARTLYEQIGFVITGETPVDYLMTWVPRRPDPS